MEERLIAQSLNGGLTPANSSNPSEEDTSHSRDPEALKALVLNRLDEEQARDVVTIELEGKSDVADAMVIASGRSHRHVGAIADKLARELKELGYGKIAVEGLPAADWVLLDAGDVVIHLFRPEVRSFYNLERIWAPELFSEESSSEFSPSTDAVELAFDDRV